MIQFLRILESGRGIMEIESFQAQIDVANAELAEWFDQWGVEDDGDGIVTMHDDRSEARE